MAGLREELVRLANRSVRFCIASLVYHGSKLRGTVTLIALRQGRSCMGRVATHMDWRCTGLSALRHAPCVREASRVYRADMFACCSTVLRRVSSSSARERRLSACFGIPPYKTLGQAQFTGNSISLSVAGIPRSKQQQAYRISSGLRAPSKLHFVQPVGCLPSFSLLRDAVPAVSIRSRRPPPFDARLQRLVPRYTDGQHAPGAVTGSSIASE
jgi:hypothetical protein